MAASGKKRKWERPGAIPFLTDFFYKTRNREFITEHGPEAMIAVLQIWCEIAREKSLKFDSAKIKYIPFVQKNDFSPSPDWYEKVFFAAVEKGLLERDGENYFNSQITKFVENLLSYTRRKMAAKNQKSGGEKYGENSNGFFAYVKNSNKSYLKHDEDPTRISKGNLKHYEDPSVSGAAKNKKSNGEKSKRGRPASELPALPGALNTPANIRAWEEFLAYRRNVKRKSVSAAAAKKIFAEFILCPNDFSPAINRSIKNDWIGIFAERGEKSKTAKNNAERNLGLLFEGAGDE